MIVIKLIAPVLHVVAPVVFASSADRQTLHSLIDGRTFLLWWQVVLYWWPVQNR